MKEMHLGTGTTLFDDIVSSSLSRSSSPLASSPVAFSPPGTCWMELPSRVIAARFVVERGTYI